MSAAITLVGYSANYPNPGVGIQLNFAQGPSAAGGGPRPMLVIGEMLSAGGSATASTVYGPDTSVTCQTEADVIALFGAGSQLHRFFLRFTAVNQVTALYFCPVADPAGTAATGTVTFTTTATGNGNARFWLGDSFVDTTIPSGQMATATATAVAANINTQTRWPVTATAAGGVVTLTAKNTGPEGNWIIYGCVVTGSPGTTCTPSLPTAMTGGATADSYSSALNAIKATRYYNIAACDSDATNIGLVCSQVNTLALPTNGIRQRVFAGFSGTLSNAITLATGLNDPRCEIQLGIGSDLTPLEVCANNAALYTLFEAQSIPRLNFSLYPTNSTDASSWKIVASRSGPSAGLTPTQITSALNNGLTPFAVLPSGQLQLQKRITTYSLNGSEADYRCRDACKVFVNDYFCDDLYTLMTQQFGGKAFIDNPPQGTTVPQGNVVWPRLLGEAADGLIETYGSNGLFQNVPAIIAGTIVQRSAVNRDRSEGLIPTQVVDILDQICWLVNQVA